MRIIKLAFSLFLLVCTLGCKNNQPQHDAYKFTNELIDETSPYLLQHAHNPVDWRAWSDEALKEAEQSNKLVLVSIGYSSCHWCHVMEKETFTDEGVAKSMNANFINIKVDREERPDLDQLYMTAVQLMQGNGGWPLNVIILPNGKPVYGGTYHTKEQWTEVLAKLNELYKKDPEKLNKYANSIAAGIRATNLIEPQEKITKFSKDTLSLSVKKWQKKWDTISGGNIENQKFIRPQSLDFLIDYAQLTNDQETKKHVINTLDNIISGGIYDHIGGGFFRYSTDPHWKVPHFEKMLYTNAQLISLYAKAYTIYKNPLYKRVVMQTITFLEREMKSQAGGYYAAIDADSQGTEGGYYQWNKKDLQHILKNEYSNFTKYYTLDTPEDTATNTAVIITQAYNDSLFAIQNDISIRQLTSLKNSWQKTLLTNRQERTSPAIDDKIITSWNALLIKGFIDAYKAFENQEYLDKAIALSSFIEENNTSDSFLVHSYKKGDKKQEGFLEDYAFLTDACIDLYSATLDTKYLDLANELHKTVTAHFTDKVTPMYTYTRESKLISPLIKVDDGVIPSPNAVMAHNLKKLGILNYNTDFTKKSDQMLSAMNAYVNDNAKDFSKWSALQLNTIYPFYEIVIVGPKADSIAKVFSSLYLPNTIVVGSTVESTLPIFKNKYVENETFIYVCQEGACKLPVQSIDMALKQL
ncbi:thioredoxin domain-containing protein [Aquimarina sp. I32.4]|uniref:thioredoxin domain-containing protein n=1 Tax=Aquimarina sp. I32.4 TaxID=2053903 RepID=UPI000CDE7D3B|nr:thioredoxin domain-containing protein [Aquimarina sp. I32.4]